MSTSASMEDMATIVTRLSKELESMGLAGLGGPEDGAVVDVISLINSSYDLIGLLRELQRSKRQREDHAQQLLLDLQRSQWLLDKEKELSLQREREAAEACEKERQANVRLQLLESNLKKKTDEHRQLAHECQLKENQWLHALRRRDQDNQKLHQQLLKFLRSKSSGGTGLIPLEVEIRGSPLVPRIAGSIPHPLVEATLPPRRKQWDRKAEDSRNLVEVKWKTAFHSLEKDHQLLRADYIQLVGMVGQFLTKCSTKLPVRLLSNPNPIPVTEWIQLPVSLMGSRLEEIFQLIENGLSLTWPQNPAEKKLSTWQSVLEEKDDSSIGTDGTTVREKLKETAVDGRMSCANDFPNRMKVDQEHQQVIVTLHQDSRANTRSTHPPSATKKSIQPISSDEPIRQSLLEAKKISFWNDRMKMNDPIPLEIHSTGHQSAKVGIIQQPHPIELDPLCPSGSRRGSSSSSSSSSSTCSSKSQSGMSNQCRQSSTSQISLMDGTSITAKVSFVQQVTSPATGQDAIDLECLVTRHLTPTDTVDYQ